MRQVQLVVVTGILMVLCAALSAAPGEDGCGLPEESIRIGFSKSIFSDVNINDAVASIEVWAHTIARSKSIPMEMEVKIYETADLLKVALIEGRVDLVGMTTPEYLQINRSVMLEHLYATLVRQHLTEEYLLLVRNDSHCTDVSQLSGMTLRALQNGRCCLASPWLELLLEQHGLPASSVHFNSIQHVNKVSLVVLPVFFGKAEACLVTRNAFETMMELNPQVGRELRVIAQSPPFVPALFCFRSSFDSEHKAKMLEGLDELHTQPSGNQVLIVFRSDRLVRMTENDLENARQLMEPYRN